jgi:metallo-beta-lactamase class B
VQAIVARAKSTAGTMWADEAHFFCEAPRANSPNDPPIEPTKIFDNVYVIGNSGTVAYVLTTSAGLVMIDALGANQVESVLLPGSRRLVSTRRR